MDDPTNERPANPWGQEISQERKTQLDGLFVRQQVWAAEPSEVRQGESVFKDVQLTGADVFWLAQRALVGPEADHQALEDAASHLRVTNVMHNLSALHLEDANLGGAHLEDANLGGAHLEGANLRGAHLEGANLRMARLEGANLWDAHLEGANLWDAHLERASLGGAHLEGANLGGAHLEDADLPEVHLEGANLGGAHLEGADLRMAHLEGANLRMAHLNENTHLEDTSLGPGSLHNWFDQIWLRNRNASLGDIKWHDANLTATPWEGVQRLGDERNAGLFDGARAHRAVVRAYRQVAQRLRDQGMADEADRFSYRAQVRQRGVLLRTFRLPQYLFSWLLAIIAGYGYRPERTLFWYVVTITGFMWGYIQVTHGVPLFGLTEPAGTQPLHWYEALVLSLASFHGRGFFPQNINLGDPVAILAASEAVIGLFVEISFIATFTQRYFGAK